MSISLESLESHWNLWNLSGIFGIFGISPESLESLESYWNLWNLIGIFGIPSEYMESHRNLWNPIGIFGIPSESQSLGNDSHHIQNLVLQRNFRASNNLEILEKSTLTHTAKNHVPPQDDLRDMEGDHLCGIITH